jgi:hypothetical protein
LQKLVIHTHYLQTQYEWTNSLCSLACSFVLNVSKHILHLIGPCSLLVPL